MAAEAQWFDLVRDNCGNEDPNVWALKLASICADLQAKRCLVLVLSHTMRDLEPFFKNFDWVNFDELEDFDAMWLDEEGYALVAIERKTAETLHNSVLDGTYTAKQMRIIKARVPVKMVVRQSMGDTLASDSPLTVNTLHAVETVAFILLQSLALANHTKIARQSVAPFIFGQLLVVLAIFVFLYKLL